jgi:hypothetical protein
MPAYAVDSSKQPMVATGVVGVVPEWEDKPDGSGRRPTDRQARDEDTGMPLWAVEVMYQQTVWGRTSSVVASVTVQGEEQPQVSALGPISFDNLQVEVRVIRSTGALVESWTAERIAGGVPGSRRSSASSGSSEAA